MKKTNYKNNQQQQQQILWNDLYNMLYAHRFHIGCLTISFSALNYESCQYVVGQSDWNIMLLNKFDDFMLFVL